MVDVAADCRVALFHVEPLGIPPFQRSVQQYIDILACHSIPKLQINAADHLGATVAFLLQPEEVSEEVEVRQNPQKCLTEMNKDQDVQYCVGVEIAQANRPKFQQISQERMNKEPQPTPEIILKDYNFIGVRH